MNKKLLSILLGYSILLLSGCALAKEEIAAREPDRLVGVYLTMEVPDSSDEHWVEYGSFGADTEFGEIQLPNMILPADFNEETEKFVFPGLEGYALFEATVQDEEGICNTVQSDLSDGKFHVTTTDYGENYEVAGTLYVGEEMEDTIWKANHVYQNKDGLVYLNGSGNSYHGVDFSSKVEETHTTTVNGEEGTVSTKAEFSIKTVQKLDRLLVHQYNGTGERIETQELSVTEDDKEVTWASGAAWAVVEEHYADIVERTAYDYPTEEAEDAYHTVIILNSDGIGEPYGVHFKR